VIAPRPHPRCTTTPAPRRTAGFTLLEILVAIGIFAVLSGLAYGTLGRLLDTRERLDAERTFWRHLAMAFTQVEDDLAVARARTVRDVYGNMLPAFQAVPVDSRAEGTPPLTFTRGGQIVIGNSIRSDMQRVGYQWTDQTLSRLVWGELDQAPQSKPQSFKLLEHVTDFALRYYVSTGGWTQVWPPQGQFRALPNAVEMTITIEGRGQFVRVFRVNG
jgi:general secretion pathway protein J